MIDTKRLLLIGGGGHCHSVLNSLIQIKQYDEIGVVAKDKNDFEELLCDNEVSDFVIGIDSDLLKLFSNGWRNAFVTLGSIGNATGRKRLYSMIKRIGFNVPSICDINSLIANNVVISEGCYIGKGVVVNAGSRIGCCAIVNTGSVIEHDCDIGEFSHISPGSILCGHVCIGSNTHIGAGSVVRQEISVGNNSVIGIGSIIVKNIPDNVKAYGNPCKVVE